MCCSNIRSPGGAEAHGVPTKQVMITVAERIDLHALQIRHEFLTVPDLRLSADTVASLLNVSPPHARQALESLVRERFLVRMMDRYSRLAHVPEA